MAHGLNQLLQQNDVLFHGSPNQNISTLEPRPAKDVDENNKFNTDMAVFASDKPCFSIIFGLVDSDKLKDETEPFGWSVDFSEDEDGRIEVLVKIPKQAKEFIENTTGFVYVLPKDTFTESHMNQHKSKVPVTPIDCIKVNLRDFYDAGGIVEWTDGDPNKEFLALRCV